MTHNADPSRATRPATEKGHDIMTRFSSRFALLLALCLTAASAVAQTTQPANAGPTLQPATPSESPAPAAKDAAQETPKEAQTQPADEQQPVDGQGKAQDWTPFLLIMGVFILMYLWMGRSRKKQEQKRRNMLESLKKGMKVTSIGGIKGTVIEVREDEVVVKVDETNNTRLHFARRAISEVEGGEESKEEKK